MQKEIANLIVVMENLIWTLFYDIFPCAGSEKHGPYPLNNSILLIREYFNLSPKEIWPIRNKYQSMKMYLRYSQDTDIKLNYANQIESSKPLNDKLIYFSIIVDKKQVNTLSQIRSLSKYFSHLIKIQAQKIHTLSPLEIIRKGAEIYYYRYKNFFDFYKEDWHPPQQVYDRINGLKLRWWNYHKGNDKEKLSPDYYVKLLDPRNNFIG